jgi:hypothetical protein
MSGDLHPVSRATEQGPFAMQGSFALLYALRHHSVPGGEPFLLPPGFAEIAAADSEAHLELLAEVEQRILGQSFQDAERIRRAPVGSMTIAGGRGAGLAADAYLVTHMAGVALFEVWLDAPLEMIKSRVAGHAHRPLARDPEKFEQLYYSRRACYEKADYCIRVTSEGSSGALKAILELPLF